MLGKLFDKILHEDEDGVNKELTSSKKSVPKPKLSTSEIMLMIVIFFVALAPRLWALFAYDTSYPGWYDDTFHHWQVAFMSKEAGFSHGFLRLWDFKGMEYFWGLMHPLVLILLFVLSGSTNILVVRLFTVVAGSVSIVLLFRLVKKYFNTQAALAATLIASLLPVSLYSDTVGMQEPLAMVFVLTGLLMWSANPIWFGLMMAFTSMVRAEYWLFSAGLVFISLFSKSKSSDHKIAAVLSYILPILLYMKYLLDHTGNAIYPIYWNFLASVKGEWFADVPLPPGALQAQMISRVIFGIGLAALLYLLIKRPRYYLFYAFGFVNIMFIGFMLGFGAYIRGYVPRFWIDRLFSWPYVFVGVLVSVLLFYTIPRKIHHAKVIQAFSWIIIIIIIVVNQAVWPFINETRIQGKVRHEGERRFAELTAHEYSGGSILIPEDRPVYVYYLVQDHGVKGVNLIGQMFDPYYYMTDPYDNWGENKDIVYDWIEESDIKLLVFYKGRDRYEELVARDPSKFIHKATIDNVLEIYEIN